MDRSVKLALLVIVISIQVSCNPTEAWYKQVAGPSYYSVGRASGLLSGIRRSPYTRSAEPEPSDNGESTVNSVLSDTGSRQNPLMKTMPICITDITPNLQSCEPLQGGAGVFQCKADVLLSLDFADCVNA